VKHASGSEERPALKGTMTWPISCELSCDAWSRMVG